MYAIKYLYSDSPIAAHIAFGGREVEFVMGNIITKRNKDELDEEVQYKLLNAYLDYKGDAFKTALMDRLLESDDKIMLGITKELHPLDYSIIHPILDMFVPMDVYHFIKTVYGLKAPAGLMDTFDERLETDNKKTRVQTYIKDDYLELATLCLIIKPIACLLTHFAYIRSKEMSKQHAGHTLLHFLKTHPIAKLPAWIKLEGSADKLVNPPNASGDADSIRILETQLPKSALVNNIVGIIIIQKISIATLIKDNDAENIVTKIYNYINNKLKNNGDVKKNIKNKTALSDAESSDNERESMMESYKIATEVPKMTEVEINHCTKSPAMIIRQYRDNKRSLINKDVLLDAISFTKIFQHRDIEETHKTILAYVFKDILFYKELDYLTLDNLINLMAVGFTLLWGIDCKHLALLLVSEQDKRNNGSISINTTVNRNRIPKETKEVLDELFPYKKVINEETSVNIAEESINMLANNLFKHNWICLADNKYVAEVLTPGTKLLPSDLKIKLANMIIYNERLIIDAKSNS